MSRATIDVAVRQAAYREVWDYLIAECFRRVQAERETPAVARRKTAAEVENSTAVVRGAEDVADADGGTLANYD